MRPRRMLALVASLAAASTSFVLAAGPASARPATWHYAHAHSCAAASGDDAACNALLRVKVSSNGKESATTATPDGFGPADLQSAYALPSATAGAGQTVAIVDAYNDPNAEADLAVYRGQYGLPACTTANGCFKKVSQTGSTTSLPGNNGGWAQEESLDLDMVSAVCPSCHILLVEATTASMTNLGIAVNEAAKLGATEISNSYGGGESTSDPTYDKSYFTHPGVEITASTGDSGYGVEYPAASPNVTAVGGTSLVKDSSTRGWSETAWGDAGSGCSAVDAQPAYQKITAITGVCGRRAVADVSAVADPNTGVAVYDSYAYQGYVGWMVFGGTSVSSPVIASVYALAGNASVVGNGYPYAHTNSLNDVTSGSNGSCGVRTGSGRHRTTGPNTALCQAVAGWDGPTGLGTPNGTGAF